MLMRLGKVVADMMSIVLQSVLGHELIRCRCAVIMCIRIMSALHCVVRCSQYCAVSSDSAELNAVLCRQIMTTPSCVIR